jgi:hypothetical protein
MKMPSKPSKKRPLIEALQHELGHAFSTGFKSRIERGIGVDNLSELLSAVREMKEKVKDEIVHGIAEADYKGEKKDKLPAGDPSSPFFQELGRAMADPDDTDADVVAKALDDGKSVEEALAEVGNKYLVKCSTSGSFPNQPGHGFLKVDQHFPKNFTIAYDRKAGTLFGTKAEAEEAARAVGVIGEDVWVQVV